MGRGGNSSAGEVKRKTLLIEGTVYDVTNFKHPGGSIIRYMCEEGVDATDAFREFHFRSEKAEKFLKSLPVVKDQPKRKFDAKETQRRQKLSDDFAKLRADLVKEGFFDPNYFHVVYRLSELLVLFACSFWMFSQHWYLPAILIGGIAQGRSGWLMHEGGHYSLTGNIGLDLRLQELVYGVGCGMSGAWWRNQHNKHHATPQKLQHDVDLDTLPLVAFNTKIRSGVKPNSFQAWWLQWQAYIFAPITCVIVGLFWTLFLHPRHILRTKRYFEAACILGRYVGWHVLLKSFGYSTQATWGLYLFTFGLGCNYIFTNFAVSHTHLDVTDPDEYLHWVEYAALHTTNVSTKSPFVTWWMSYLNFQIEHHLFPSCPQFRFPEISVRIRKLFEENNLKYDERPYTQALRDTFNNLDQV